MTRLAWIVVMGVATTTAAAQAPRGHVGHPSSSGDGPRSGSAGSPGSTRTADSIRLAPMLMAARRATERYRSLEAAIADGFRRTGPDMPTLGEHWVSLSRIASGGVDPDNPPVLIYVRRQGSPVLAGIAYTALLGAGEAFPDAPVPARYWHEHNGSVAEEILPLSHGAHRLPANGTRLAVAHAWVWLENPAGVWESDHWALPWQRLGISVDTIVPNASRAAALMSGGDEYYANVIGVPAARAAHVRSLLEAARDSVAMLVRGATSVDAAGQVAIAAIWARAAERIIELGDPAWAERARHILLGQDR